MIGATRLFFWLARIEVMQDASEDALPLPEIEAPREWPQWGWVDVGAAFLIFAIVTIGVTVLGIAIAPKTPFFSGMSAAEVVKQPLFFIPTQLLSYVIAFLFVRVYITLKADEDFWVALHWKWPPVEGVLGNLLLGVALAIIVLLLQTVVPMPKSLPIEEYFKERISAILMGAFAILVAPLAEEIFFRGLLLPVAARTLTRVGGVLFVSALFGLVHSAQLGSALAPILVLFGVGVAFSIRRLRAQSLAAAWLMHVGYNFTLFALMFWVTRGFTQLDKLR